MGRYDDSDEEETQVATRVLERRALKALEQVFREADGAVAGMRCPASGDCCQLAVTGRQPNLLPVERLRLRLAVEKAGRTWPTARADGACAFVDSSGRRCSVYPDRPFGCRTFFCSRGEGKAASAAIHAAGAKLVRASDELEPNAQPVPILSLFMQPR